MKRAVFLIAVTFLPSLLHAASLPDPFALKVIQAGEFEIKVQRLPQNPIISCESSITLSNKINSPSLIEVPDWIDPPLGKYCLNFAHHEGKFIRPAYANSHRRNLHFSDFPAEWNGTVLWETDNLRSPTNY